MECFADTKCMRELKGHLNTIAEMEQTKQNNFNKMNELVNGLKKCVAHNFEEQNKLHSSRFKRLQVQCINANQCLNEIADLINAQSNILKKNKLHLVALDDDTIGVMHNRRKPMFGAMKPARPFLLENNSVLFLQLFCSINLGVQACYLEQHHQKRMSQCTKLESITGVRASFNVHRMV